VLFVLVWLGFVPAANTCNPVKFYHLMDPTPKKRHAVVEVSVPFPIFVSTFRDTSHILSERHGVCGQFYDQTHFKLGIDNSNQQ
jgi:hypothetical protein